MFSIKKHLFLLKINRYLRSIGFYQFLSDEFFCKFIYAFEFDKELNLINPKTYSEKINYIKLYDRNLLYPTLVDKAEMKKHLRTMVSNEYLVPTLQLVDQFEDIDFDSLPKQFVLKCTHGSGANYICFDKDQLDYKKLKKTFDQWLKRNWYDFGREWPYKDLKPKIIIEPLIGEGVTPNEFLFYVYNHKVKYVFYVKNRKRLNKVVTILDRNFKPMPFTLGNPYTFGTQDSKPESYDKMIELSEKLCSDLNMIFLRVDFYEWKNRCFIGELTLTPTAGFSLIRDFDGNDAEFEFGKDLILDTDGNKYEVKHKRI